MKTYCRRWGGAIVKGEMKTKAQRNPRAREYENECLIIQLESTDTPLS